MDNKNTFPPLFTAAEDWENNACIPDGTADSILYIEGYRRAAEYLVAEVQASARNQDFLVYPIIFLYRHYLELILKSIISDSQELLDEPKKPRISHCLQDLWPEAKGLLRKIHSFKTCKETQHLDHVIAEFAKLDPTGETFRYPFTLEGETLLSGLKHINLRHLADQLKKVSDLLDGVSMGVSAALDTKYEVARYYCEEMCDGE